MSKCYLVLIAVAMMFSAVASAATMDFDSYADNAAWEAAGSDGWTATAGDGCAMWLGGTTGNNYLIMNDGSTGAVISIANSSFGDIRGGGSIAFDVYEQPLAGYPMHYYVRLFDDGQLMSFLSIQVYNNQMNMLTAGGYAALVPAGGSNVWKTFRLDISNGGLDLYINDVSAYSQEMAYYNGATLTSGIDEIHIESPLAGYRGLNAFDNFNFVVPEPMTCGMVAVGACAGLLRRKRS